MFEGREFDVVAYPPLPREARDLLRGYSLAQFRYGEEDALLKALGSAKAFIVIGLRIDEGILARAPNLRVIIARTDGLDYIDLEAARKANVCVANQPEAIAESVAEYVVGAVISVMRYMGLGHEYVVGGEWLSRGWPSHLRGSLLLGRSLGLLGFGRIAHLLAIKFRSLGIKDIYYWSRTRIDRSELILNAVRLSLREVFSRSDIVVNTLPDTSGTHHIVNAELLKLIPKGGVFINVGRGGVLSLEDLVKTLEARRDLRVVLDVYEEEPLSPEHPLISKYSRSGRILLTPHIAGYSEESMRITALLAVMQVKKFLAEGCLWDPALENCRQCPDSPPPLKDIMSMFLRRRN